MSATAEPNSHQLGSRMSLKSGPATTWLVHSNVSQLTYVSILFPRSGSLLPLETPAEGPYILPVPFPGLTSTRTEVTGTAVIGSPRPLKSLKNFSHSRSGCLPVCQRRHGIIASAGSPTDDDSRLIRQSRQSRSEMRPAAKRPHWGPIGLQIACIVLSADVPVCWAKATAGAER